MMQTPYQKTPLGVWSIIVLTAALGFYTPSALAFWGLLGKLGSAAGKGSGAAGAVGKGAAAGGAAVAGAEIANGAGTAAKAAKAGAAVEGAGSATAANSIEDLSKASGLGKAVPDDIAAMFTPGKALADVPDVGARGWLSMPNTKLKPADADLMVHDYVKLLEGKPAKGPPTPAAPNTQAIKPANTAQVLVLPTKTATSRVPWHAMEILVRAAQLGHKGAQTELERVCAGQSKNKIYSPQCQRPVATKT